MTGRQAAIAQGLALLLGITAMVLAVRMIGKKPWLQPKGHSVK